MDPLSHRFNGCEWSIPIRSRASVEDSGPWSGLFPALGSEGCYAEGWGNIQRGEKQIKLATNLLFSSFVPLSLLRVHTNENKPTQLLQSPRIHSEQFGVNWMNRNKWADIALYGRLLQGLRQWLEAHGPFYPHSKKMGEKFGPVKSSKQEARSGGTGWIIIFRVKTGRWPCHPDLRNN